MNLAQAVENLYVAFAGVPKPTGIDACPCCLDEDEIRVVLQAPLRDLSADELQSYAASVLYTVGSWDDFRYFLPRLLELASQGALIWPDAELMVKRVSYGLAQGNTLGDAEQAALDSFLCEWWHGTLAQAPDDVALPAEIVLAAVLSAGYDLNGLLRSWKEHPNPNAVWHLAKFIKQNITLLALGKTMNHHLDNGHEVAFALLQWLTGTEVRQWLETAFFADPDGPAAQDISDALLYLGNPS